MTVPTTLFVFAVCVCVRVWSHCPGTGMVAPVGLVTSSLRQGIGRAASDLETKAHAGR